MAPTVRPGKWNADQASLIAVLRKEVQSDELTIEHISILLRDPSNYFRMDAKRYGGDIPANGLALLENPDFLIQARIVAAAEAHDFIDPITREARGLIPAEVALEMLGHENRFIRYYGLHALIEAEESLAPLQKRVILKEALSDSSNLVSYAALFLGIRNELLTINDIGKAATHNDFLKARANKLIKTNYYPAWLLYILSQHPEKE